MKIKLTDKYSVEKLTDCVCLNIKNEAINKETKEPYLKTDKRYYASIWQALKWFVYNYVEDESIDVKDVIYQTEKALDCLEKVSDEIKELLNK